MKKIGKIFRKKLMVGWLVASVMLMYVACGSSSDSAASMSVSMSPMEANGAVAEEKYYETTDMWDGGSVKYESAASESGATTSADTASAAQSNASEVAATNRKLIKTVDMNVETQSFDELLSTIQGQVSTLGGYIESMNTYNGSAYSGYRSSRNASMTIRIPKDNLDGFLNTVSGISNVVRRSDSVEDVTLAYVDLESHRNALEIEQERLLSFLEKAETIEEIITIESRLSDVRYQLESMESRLRTYDNQVDYSTVYLNIEEVEIFTPVEEETVLERISGGFAESLDNVGDGFVEFGIWIVVNSPYLVVAAVFVAAFIGVITWLSKRSAKATKQQKNEIEEDKTKENKEKE